MSNTTAALPANSNHTPPDAAIENSPPASDENTAALVPVGGKSPREPFTRANTIPFNGAQITEATADLPEDQSEAIRWLFRHGKSKGDSLSRLAKRIDYTYHTLRHVFKGDYGASLLPVVAAINRYREIAEAREKVGRPAFIPTTVATLIWDYCGDALTFQRVGVIIGDYQIGKTFSLEAYTAEHNHGQTRYVRLPAGCGFRQALQYIAAACDVPPRQCIQDLRDGIFRALDSRHLLIVDEVDEPLAGRFALGAVQIYMFLREVYDRCKCGVILCGNSTFDDALSDKGALGPWMTKLKRRAMRTLRLPTEPPEEDLWLLAAHYGLPTPAPGSQASATARKIGKDEGIGQFTIFCQQAARAALTLQEEIAWKHFLIACGEIKPAAATANGKEGR